MPIQKDDKPEQTPLPIIRPLELHTQINNFMRKRIDLREYLNIPFRVIMFETLVYNNQKSALLYLNSWIDDSKYEATVFDVGQRLMFESIAKNNQFPVDVVWIQIENDKRLQIRSATEADINKYRTK